MFTYRCAFVVLSALCSLLPALLCPIVRADDPLIIELLPGKVPDEAGDIGAEKIVMSPVLDRKQVEVTESTRMLTNVTKPAIAIYRPAKETDTGAAVIICPGGAYWTLYRGLE